jgi:Serine protease Clip domain PPAF-2
MRSPKFHWARPLAADSKTTSQNEWKVAIQLTKYSTALLSIRRKYFPFPAEPAINAEGAASIPSPHPGECICVPRYQCHEGKIINPNPALSPANVDNSGQKKKGNSIPAETIQAKITLKTELEPQFFLTQLPVVWYSYMQYISG